MVHFAAADNFAAAIVGIAVVVLAVVVHNRFAVDCFGLVVVQRQYNQHFLVVRFPCLTLCIARIR